MAAPPQSQFAPVEPLAVNHPLYLAVLGSGNGTDLQYLFDYLDREPKTPIEVAVVVSNKRNAPILDKARERLVPVFWLDYKNYKSQESAERHLASILKGRFVDIVLLVGYMRILGPTFVEAFRGRIWNVHPSLLPKHAGGMDLDVHKAVLDAKETVTGCTLHEVTEEVDAGPIIAQKEVPVLPDDTPESLKKRVQQAEGEIIVDALRARVVYYA